MHRVQRAYHTLHAGMPVRVANAQLATLLHTGMLLFPKHHHHLLYVSPSARPPVLCILVATYMPNLYYVYAS